MKRREFITLLGGSACGHPSQTLFRCWPRPCVAVGGRCLVSCDTYVGKHNRATMPLRPILAQQGARHSLRFLARKQSASRFGDVFEPNRKLSPA